MELKESSAVRRMLFPWMLEYTSSPSNNICRHSIRKLPQPIVHLLRDTALFEFQQKAEKIRKRKKRHDMVPLWLHMKKDFNLRNFFHIFASAVFARLNESQRFLANGSK